MPKLVMLNGRLQWLFDDGTSLPVISGGAPDDDGGGGDDGGDEGGDDDADDDGDDEDDDPDSDAKGLGDAGKKALKRERDARKADKKNARRREAALRKEIAQLKSTSTDKDKDEAGAKRVAELEEKLERQGAKARGNALRAEVKAAAAGKLVNPADAIRFLDLDEFEVDDDGEVDVDEIEAAIEKLLEDRPYLAASKNGSQDGKEKRKPSGDADGGTRKSTKPEPAMGIGRLRNAYAESSKRKK